MFALCAAAAMPAAAQQDLRPLVNALAEGGFAETEQQIGALAATGDPAVVPVLQALAAGDLYFRKADKAVFIARRAGGGYALTDPLTGESAGDAPRSSVEKIKVNNRLRTAVRTALGALTLLSPDPARRRAAVETLMKSADADSIELLDTAIAQEKDAGIAALMEEARAVAVLRSGRPD